MKKERHRWLGWLETYRWWAWYAPWCGECIYIFCGNSAGVLVVHRSSPGFLCSYRDILRFHYHVWNSLENVGSLFVKLASFDDTTWQETQTQGFKGQPLAYLLNFSEMWLCCAFQKLTTNLLRVFCPAYTLKPWSGFHLNVAAPLWQWFHHQGRASNPEVNRETLKGPCFLLIKFTASGPNDIEIPIMTPPKALSADINLGRLRTLDSERNRPGLTYIRSISHSLKE